MVRLRAATARCGGDAASGRLAAFYGAKRYSAKALATAPIADAVSGVVLGGERRVGGCIILTLTAFLSAKHHEF